jgi:hypothetical protein
MVSFRPVIWFRAAEILDVAMLHLDFNIVAASA